MRLFCLPLMSVLDCPNTLLLPLILELLQQKKTCQHKNDIKAEKKYFGDFKVCREISQYTVIMLTIYHSGLCVVFGFCLGMPTYIFFFIC